MSGCTLPELRRLLISEVYGQASTCFAWLEDQDVSYVLAIKRNDTSHHCGGEQRASTASHRAAGLI